VEKDGMPHLIHNSESLHSMNHHLDDMTTSESIPSKLVDYPSSKLSSKTNKYTRIDKKTFETNINIFIDNIQENKPDTEFSDVMTAISNNFTKTARLTGIDTKDWKPILKIGNELGSFATNLKTFSSAQSIGNFSIDMCTSYWGMAVSALSIISSILNEDEDDEDNPFNLILEELHYIQVALKKGFDRLESILLNCVCTRLDTLCEHMNRMETIMCDSFKDLHRKDFIKAANAVKKDLSGEFQLTQQERRNVLMELSNWIDSHSNVSIENSKNRIDLKFPHILIQIVESNYLDVLGNVIFAIIDSNQSFPNVNVSLLACELFILAYNKWNISYNVEPLFERVRKIIDESIKLMDTIDISIFDRVVRQIHNHYFVIGRIIAKSGIQLTQTSLVEQFEKMTQKDEIHFHINSIELKRRVVIKMCQLKELDYAPIKSIKTKSEYLAQSPNIDATPNRTSYSGMMGCRYRSSPAGGHLAAEKGSAPEILRYLQMGLNVNAHCGWGNVLLNLLNGSPEHMSLHHLLKCSELDTTSGQSCHTDPNSTWPVGSRPIQYILNRSFMKLAILFVANGYDIDLTNYGAHWNGGMWGDCGNLYAWASSGNKESIQTLEIIQAMEDPHSIMYKAKLRRAYKYYKEFEAGSIDGTKFDGNINSLLVFVCLLGQVPPIIRNHTNPIKSDKITDSVNWYDLGLSEKSYQTINTTKPNPQLLTESYVSYLESFKNKLVSIKNTSNPTTKWIDILEPICMSTENHAIINAFNDAKKGSIQELNYLNALLKLFVLDYQLGSNIDMFIREIVN
jgi:hypothetical protein